MKRPRILILGGAGYVGGHLTDLLSAKGFPVLVYDNLFYESRFLKDVPFVRGDVRDYRRIASLLGAGDVVIALAAVVGDDACAAHPAMARAVNVDSVRWLSAHVTGKIIFASTCLIYKSGDTALHEASPLEPLSLYARTKMRAEEFLRASPRGKQHAILRFATLYGVSDRFSRPRFDLLVNALSRDAALRKPLVVFGKERRRSFVHVRDVAEAILFAIQKDLSGVYNVTRETARIGDVAEMVREEANQKKIRVRYLPLRSGDARNYTISGRTLAALGFRPRRTLAEGIREVYGLVSSARVTDAEAPVYSNAAWMKQMNVSLLNLKS